MDFAYVAYTRDKRLVKGKLSASSQEVAVNMLNYGGYQVVNLKASTPFISLEMLKPLLAKKVKQADILLFSRQLALLVESGMDIVTSLEMLQGQLTNPTLRDVIGKVVSDIREGKSLSAALGMHPHVFPSMYYRAIAAGEQGGSLDIILKQMADFLEKSINVKKKLKSAMTYPIIIVTVAVIVVGVLTIFVFPAFLNLFTSLGAKLPAVTQLLFALVSAATTVGPYLMVLALIVGAIGYAYTRTPKGKYAWDRLSLSLPVVGRVNLLNELSYVCRIMALLIKAGLSMPEILKLAIHGTNNKYVSEALTGVQQELIRGEGLSRPMSRRKVFLPLMVQMLAIGEESGNLTNSLNTVAQSYETESDDRTRAAIGLIQPAITLGLGVVVAFVALALISAMFGIYGQLGL